MKGLYIAAVLALGGSAVALARTVAQETRIAELEHLAGSDGLTLSARWRAWDESYHDHVRRLDIARGTIREEKKRLNETIERVTALGADVDRLREAQPPAACSVGP